MRKNIAYVFVLLLTVACSSKGNREHVTATPEQDDPKIITAGGTITEIVHALGHGDAIVATDRTSTYPSQMQTLPSIGYRNQIQAEGILSLNPDWILVEEHYLNQDVVTQLQNSGKQVTVLPKPQSEEAAAALIKEIGGMLEEKERAEGLIEQLTQDLETLRGLKAENDTQPKVAFIMSRGPEMVFLAGKNTFASAMIALSGGQPVEVDFEGMKPLTPEALPALNPDYILMFESGFQASGGKEGLRAIQGITETNAWKKDQFVVMDGHYVSSFGPRLGQAAIELFEKTHP
ncbi:heme/hemin ABC transporter substrate-binding protein [Echinicola vietnamensis]|uniref:ABC-type hemin transport system, periplasmic component n=1 Tax=Echinicola vietnamensis (strain DSM 17526 / LMG 23754 / KMM 6221) TaxID=926556 RepID=L0G1Z9_ECHVK|nr:ABC transporter substrate-binding protein [Echinicola vietnamensis]AGA79348.1 ABC-type hemin transport system, periplasmic component [Echinicola vietnamensis DSM 17526]